MLRHFVEVARESQEILTLNLSEFYEIIADDMLNTKDEAPVWECCLRWIEHSPDMRKQHITKLLGGIRLGLLDLEVRVFSFNLFII